MIQEVYGNFWDILPEYDGGGILVNWTTGYKGQAIMGGGQALDAALRYPELPEVLGRIIKNNREPCVAILRENPCLFSFPTKFEVWHKSPLPLILESITQLLQLDSSKRWLLPRPGCGLGGLDYEREVKPALIKMLAMMHSPDDAITIVHFANTK